MNKNFPACGWTPSAYISQSACLILPRSWVSLEGMAALELSSVTKVYGDKVAVKDLRSDWSRETSWGCWAATAPANPRR